MNELRKKLIAFGFQGVEKMTDDELMQLSSQMSQAQQPVNKPLLGGEASGTGSDVAESLASVEEPPTKEETAGGPGTWETAMMSVAKTVPSIIQLMQFRRPHAPAANIGGRRVMDIPTAGAVYGKPSGGFQSLLARLLMGR